jgi:hypothetical protein
MVDKKCIERKALLDVIKRGNCTNIFLHNRKKFYFIKLWNINPQVLDNIMKNALIARAKELGAIDYCFKYNSERRRSDFIAYFQLGK